jgi:GNAT superfamily N-acetyltransferase
MSATVLPEDGSSPSASEPELLPSSLVSEAANVMALAFVDSPAWVELIRGHSSTRVRALAWIFEVYLCAVRRKDPTAVHCILARSDAIPLGGNHEKHGDGIDGGKPPADAAVATATEPSPAVLAAAIFLAPSARPTLPELLCAGLAFFPLRFGIAATCRLWRLMDWFEHAQEDIWGDREPAFGGDAEKNCPAIATPSLRLSSRPLFSRAQAIALERMVVRPDCQGRGLGSALLRGALADLRRDGQTVVLTTQDKRNVNFYSRLGFRVRSERDYIPSDAHGDGAQYAFHCWFMDTWPTE